MKTKADARRAAMDRRDYKKKICKHDWELLSTGMPVITRCKKCGTYGPLDSQGRHRSAGLP